MSYLRWFCCMLFACLVVLVSKQNQHHHQHHNRWLLYDSEWSLHRTRSMTMIKELRLVLTNYHNKRIVLHHIWMSSHTNSKSMCKINFSFDTNLVYHRTHLVTAMATEKRHTLLCVRRRSVTCQPNSWLKVAIVCLHHIEFVYHLPSIRCGDQTMSTFYWILIRRAAQSKYRWIILAHLVQ